MSPDKMVRMANQIATFFKTQPGVDAAEKVGGHIKDYWDPRMRQQLLDHIANGGEGLDASVIRAAGAIA